MLKPRVLDIANLSRLNSCTSTVIHTLWATMEYVECEGVVTLVLSSDEDGIEATPLAEVSQHLGREDVWWREQQVHHHVE